MASLKELVKPSNASSGSFSDNNESTIEGLEPSSDGELNNSSVSFTKDANFGNDGFAQIPDNITLVSEDVEQMSYSASTPAPVVLSGHLTTEEWFDTEYTQTSSKRPYWSYPRYRSIHSCLRVARSDLFHADTISYLLQYFLKDPFSGNYPRVYQIFCDNLPKGKYHDILRVLPIKSIIGPYESIPYCFAVYGQEQAYLPEPVNGLLPKTIIYFIGWDCANSVVITNFAKNDQNLEHGPTGYGITEVRVNEGSHSWQMQFLNMPGYKVAEAINAMVRFVLPKIPEEQLRRTFNHNTRSFLSPELFISRAPSSGAYSFVQSVFARINPVNSGSVFNATYINTRVSAQYSALPKIGGLDSRFFSTVSPDFLLSNAVFMKGTPFSSGYALRTSPRYLAKIIPGFQDAIVNIDLKSNKRFFPSIISNTESYECFFDLLKMTVYFASKQVTRYGLPGVISIRLLESPSKNCLERIISDQGRCVSGGRFVQYICGDNYRYGDIKGDLLSFLKYESARRNPIIASVDSRRLQEGDELRVLLERISLVSGRNLYEFFLLCPAIETELRWEDQQKENTICPCPSSMVEASNYTLPEQLCPCYYVPTGSMLPSQNSQALLIGPEGADYNRAGLIVGSTATIYMGGLVVFGILAAIAIAVLISFACQASRRDSEQPPSNEIDLSNTRPLLNDLVNDRIIPRADEEDENRGGVVMGIFRNFCLR